jgi:4'-phosphopantetheinyl transferase
MNDSSRDHATYAAAEANGLLALSVGDIHLWLTFYDEITDEHLHSAYRKLLNASEKEQELRFHFARDRRRYLITRALLRTVLSRYARIQPAEWIFSTNAYGRPHIANADVGDAPSCFNISHTHSLIVLGVTRQRALGVDVENFRQREVSIDIANRYFAPPEIAALSTVPAHEQQYRFLEYWTFKESYIKARGMGLSLPLEKFSFHYPDDRSVNVSIHPELADDAARWQFWQFRPRPDYLLAVCAERVGADTPKLIFWETVPMLSESEFMPEVLRVSRVKTRNPAIATDLG